MLNPKDQKRTRRKNCWQKKKRLEKELEKIAKKEEGDYQAKFEDLGREDDDRAEEVESYAAKVAITETLEKSLKDVLEALEKIKNGTYGQCENCQAEIPLERLKAYPAAKTCLK